MLYSLLHGDLATALRFNAFGLVAVLFLLWAYMAWSYGCALNRKISSWQHHPWMPGILLAGVAIWLVIRNLPFAQFSGLRV